MHDTRVVLKTGEVLEASIWEWRPADGYFTLAGRDERIYFRDVVSAETPGQRAVTGLFTQDELARARENGWDDD